jgi:hypothetical protein
LYWPEQTANLFQWAARLHGAFFYVVGATTSVRAAVAASGFSDRIEFVDAAIEVPPSSIDYMYARDLLSWRTPLPEGIAANNMCEAAQRVLTETGLLWVNYFTLPGFWSLQLVRDVVSVHRPRLRSLPSNSNDDEVAAVNEMLDLVAELSPDDNLRASLAEMCKSPYSASVQELIRAPLTGYHHEEISGYITKASGLHFFMDTDLEALHQERQLAEELRSRKVLDDKDRPLLAASYADALRMRVERKSLFAREGAAAGPLDMAELLAAKKRLGFE